VCVHVAARGQKHKVRRGNLARIGGASVLVEQWNVSGMEVPDDQLAVLVDFLASQDGLDFHSDEDTPTAAVAPGALKEGEAALAGVQRTWYRPEERVVLKHTFRSELATDILHALDQASGIRGGALSSEFGANLSVRMATKLQKRPDLSMLIDEKKVNAVAAKASKKRRSDVVEAMPPPAKRQQVSWHACAATA
jgi:hypothetical protein